MREAHEGICASHQASKVLVWKAILSGYYGLTMMMGAKEKAKKCESCQRHAHLQHTPQTEYNSILIAWSFHTWGMDILGQFPKATAQRKFLLVAIDLFTKWIEAESLATIIAKKVKRFAWNNIVCKFRMPKAFLTDNGTQSVGKEFREFCGGLHISTKHTSVEHLATNGQME